MTCDKEEDRHEVTRSGQVDQQREAERQAELKEDSDRRSPSQLIRIALRQRCSNYSKRSRTKTGLYPRECSPRIPNLFRCSSYNSELESCRQDQVWFVEVLGKAKEEHFKRQAPSVLNAQF